MITRSGLRAFRNTPRFSVRMFLLILVCVVLPLLGLSIYVRSSMEQFIQNKLSENVIHNIARGERNISDALQSMASVTNIFVYDEELRRRITDATTSEYENSKYFDQMIDRLYIINDQKIFRNMKIVLFDNHGRIYSNWSMNYQNYEFLLEQDWIKGSMGKDGHVVWSMFSPAYIVGEESEETYITLAKTLLDGGTIGTPFGILLISIGQQQFGELLMEYAYPGDMVYVSIEEGTVLFKTDTENQVGEERIQELYQLTRDEKSGNLKYKMGEGEYLVSFYTIPEPWIFNEQQMKIFHFTSYQAVSDQMDMIGYRMNLFILIVMVILIAVLYLSVKMLVKPIADLSLQMKNYTLDGEIIGIDVNRSDEIGQLNRSFFQMSDNIKQLFRQLDEEHEIKERYRYESLRAQLNPHFLFNTLTTIRWMAIIRGADNIVEAIDALAHMLGYSMERSGHLVTVKDEVENIKDYLYIQNCRFGNHCRLDVDLEEEVMVLPTMKFILQPIVENAVIHGYDKNREEIRIQIYGRIEADHLLIYVEDDGTGMNQAVIEEFESSKQMHDKAGNLTGIGMKTVDECIRITWGDNYGLTIESQENQGTIVKYTLPVIQGEIRTDEEGNDSR